MLSLSLFLITISFASFASADSGADGVFFLVANESIGFMFAPNEGDLLINAFSSIGLFDVTVLPETQYDRMQEGYTYTDYESISEILVQSYSWSGPFFGDEYYNWIVFTTEEDFIDIQILIYWTDDCIYANTTTGMRPPRTVPEYITKAVYPTRTSSAYVEKICSSPPIQECPPPSNCAGHVAISLSAIGLWFLTLMVGGTYFVLLKMQNNKFSAHSLHREEMLSLPRE
jgi:hypothetical protein